MAFFLKFGYILKCFNTVCRPGSFPSDKTNTFSTATKENFIKKKFVIRELFEKFFDSLEIKRYRIFQLYRSLYKQNEKYSKIPS